MNILIAVASKHGSTQEIAEAIGQELRAAGHTVDVYNVEETPVVDGYDATIIGSAVYMGKWLAPAREFVDRHQAQLAALPVYLFSSGPLGAENPQPPGDPEGIEELVENTGTLDHRVFVGKLDNIRCFDYAQFKILQSVDLFGFRSGMVVAFLPGRSRYQTTVQ